VEGGTTAEVRFRGRPIVRRPGETLLQLLARSGFPVVQRSIRYHRPRGAFCGVGACTHCLVRVNGVPNVRACEYEPADGDRIQTENAWPSPRWDLLGVFDLLFPRGLDTLHGFRRPGWAAPVYQRVVRRLAGYGRLPDATQRPIPPTGERIDTDVLVIGGGRSGRAAAERLVAGGRNIVVLDRRAVSPPFEGGRWLTGSTVAFLPRPVPGRPRPFVAIASRRDGSSAVVRARQVVVAVGGYGGPLLFPGNDRPGVLTAEGALALVAPGATPPFRRALVFGGGPRVLEILDRFASHIETIAAPGSVRGEIAERAAPLEIPVHPRSLLVGVSGRHRVRRAHLRTRGGGPSTDLDADAVILAHRRLPNPQLFYQAGAAMEWRSEGGAYFPVLGEGGGTSVPGLFASGTAGGFDAVGDSTASGHAAADAVLGRPWEPSALPSRVGAAVPNELEGYYRELLSGPRHRGKWILCPCEDVLLHEAEDAVARGFRGIEVIKRMTGVGTGLCQGRYCLPDALLVLALLESRSPSEIGYLTQRPPFLPTRLDTLASLPEDEPELAEVP
jgi:sarcosine oxidase subunit alpha